MLGRVRWLLLFGLVAIAAACRHRASVEADRPIVVSTTPMLADLVRSVSGGAVDTISLVPIGADPHLYQPTPGNVLQLRNAAMFVRNGLFLEGWADDLARNLPDTARTVTGSDAIEALVDETGVPDPHVWLDVSRWRQIGQHVGSALIGMPAATPELRTAVTAAMATFDAEAEALDAWIRSCLATIPEGRRVLVTSHDAFAYYGEAYGLRVVAIQGVSTAAEASHHDVARVVSVVRESGVPAIFVETSVQSGLLEQVSRETGVALAGPLFSDSLGDPGSGAETWGGMLRENTTRIASALGGACDPAPVRP